MNIIEKWIAVIRNPKETLAAEKSSSSISQGIAHLALAGAIVGLLMGVAIWLVSIGISRSFGTLFSGNEIGIAMGLMYAIMGLVLVPIITIFSAFINNGIIYLSAKLLSGKGTFAEQFYLHSLVQSPFQLIIAASYVFILVPIVGFLVLMPLILILGLAALYYQVLAVAEAHQVSTGRGLAIVLLPAVLVVALLFLLVIPASVLWYTGVFNPSKFRGGSECGGFGVFTCVDQTVSVSSTVIILGNALGRQMEVQSVSLGGGYAPKQCSIDSALGASTTVIAPNGRIYIECGPAAAYSGTAYDWRVTATYADSQTGLQKTDTGGFVRGTVS